MALPLTEGRDTRCVDAYKPGQTARGVELVAQRCYHRLVTPAGMLRGGEDEADFGLDLSAEVGKIEPRNATAILPVRVRNELLKDPTVNAVNVVATRTQSGGEVAYRMVVKVESDAGPFEMLVAVSDVTVELLGVR